MSRRILTLALSLFLGAAIVLADSNVPKENTRPAIKKYVQAAARYVHKHGPSCDEFAEKDWRSGDYYIFVTGPDEKELCHPNKDMIGKPASEIVDSNGKKVGTELVAAAKKKGGGWVDYVWPRPGTTKPVAKSSYSMSVKGPDGKTYYVGSGGYELK
jgi:signal transduction histidine kinase